jgi:hypothetical protein
VRHVIIEDGVATNVVDYESDISGQVPPGMGLLTIALASEVAQIGWTWDGEVLAPPALTPAQFAAAKAARVAALTAACQAAIVGGCVSEALGAPHTYPSSATDQINMLGRVAQAQIDPATTLSFWCADVDGAWAKRAHTAAQMIRVGLDAAAWVQTNSDRLTGADGGGGLVGQVLAATTPAEVEAVVW